MEAARGEGAAASSNRGTDHTEVLFTKSYRQCNLLKVGSIPSLVRSPEARSLSAAPRILYLSNQSSEVQQSAIANRRFVTQIMRSALGNRELNNADFKISVTNRRSAMADC